MANGDIAYTGPRMADASLVTADELASGKVQAPDGTTPYTVQPGDNLTKIATAHGYGNPPDMKAFYADNKQYEQRNPDLIYPGETVFVKPPTNGTAATGQRDPKTNEPVYQNYKDGKPSGEPYSAKPNEQGAPTDSTVINGKGEEIRTDENGNPKNGPVNQGANGDGTNKYQDYKDGKPVGDPYSSKPDANGQPTTKEPASKPDPKTDTSQAAPGTPIRLGPYTEGYGPYMPNTTVKLKDGSSLLIGDNGYPKNGAVDTSCTTNGQHNYQNYKDGKPVGEPYAATPTPNGPANARTINDKGEEIWTDDAGKPRNGAVDVSTQCYADGHKDIQDYKDGKPVGAPYQVDADGKRIGAKPTGLMGPYDTSTPAGRTSQAASAYAATEPSPIAPSVRDPAEQAFIRAVRAELDAGVSPQAIKERYGNYPYLNAAIDKAAAK